MSFQRPLFEFERPHPSIGAMHAKVNSNKYMFMMFIHENIKTRVYMHVWACFSMFYTHK